MNRTRVKRYIYLMKEMVGDGVEGCDGDDGDGRAPGGGIKELEKLRYGNVSTETLRTR